MKKLLSLQHSRFVAKWIRESGRVVFVFDFDGTLAPIVANRQKAFMRATTRRRIAQLARKAPTAILSGRALTDLLPRLEKTRVAKAVGNHGAEGLPEISRNLREKKRQVRSWEKLLRRELSNIEGLDFENKGYSLAVHYRNAASPLNARRQIDAALRAHAKHFASAKVIHGKAVVDMMPGGLPNKGTALLELMRIFKADRAVYVGDDTTDEDVFALRMGVRRASKPQLLKVRVGARRNSRADYYVSTQRDMDELLALFLANL